MALVTIHSDFGAQEKDLPLFSFFPHLCCHEVMGQDAMICFLNVELFFFKYGMLHEFAYHPCAGAMLTSVSFQF